jgi:membrane associated rhomboid family serine protease
VRPSFGTAGSALPAPVRILLMANVGIFLVDYLTRGALFFPLMALDPWAVTRDFQVWRIVSYMFVHDFNGILHIAFNMLMLWMFGTPVAREMGDRSFWILYLLSGAFAGVLSLVFYGATGNPTVIVGASGAIFALLIAFARFHPDQQLLMFFLFPIPVRVAVLIFVVISLLLLRADDGIAHIAHLGGALFGWVYLRWFWSPSRGGFLAQWKQRKNRNRWEKAMRDGEKLREAMEDIDPILHKISTQGMESLSREEKKKLERVSEMKKKLHGTDLPISDYYKNR